MPWQIIWGRSLLSWRNIFGCLLSNGWFSSLSGEMSTSYLVLNKTGGLLDSKNLTVGLVEVKGASDLCITSVVYQAHHHYRSSSLW